MRFLLFLLLAVSVSASVFDSAIVQTQVNVSSSVSAVSVDRLQADLVFVPLNSDFQSVRSISLFPSGQLTQDRARFVFNKPGEISFGYSALVDVANNAPRVRASIPLKPISQFPEFRKPTQYIDSDDANVVRLAREITSNVSDLFSAVSRIGFWVRENIEYDLSSLTADVSQSASWVLKNRRGVCDELTNAFIAMVRSLGVPARFVSGVSYTNSPLFPNNFGAHGWAQVYFPGVGWVPFDPTFGQFGWVDPGHVVLKLGADPREPTSVVEWSGTGAKVDVRDVNVSASVVSMSGVVSSDVFFRPSVLHSRVGFDSHNVLILDVENLADYFVAPDFVLAKVDMLVVDEQSKGIVLGPREKGRLFWVVKVKSGESRLQYEVPLRVVSSRQDNASVSFVSTAYDQVFSRDAVLSSVRDLELRPSRSFGLSCSLDKDQVWLDESVSVSCGVSGSGVVSVCLDSCSQVTAPGVVSFVVPSQGAGSQVVRVVGSSGGEEVVASLVLSRLGVPSIVIKDVSAPSGVSFGDVFDVRFVLARDGFSFPQGVSVELSGSGARSFLSIGELSFEQEVVVKVDSSQLFDSVSEFDIVVDFVDVRGVSYSVSGSVSVRVDGVPLWRRVVGFFVGIFNF